MRSIVKGTPGTYSKGAVKLITDTIDDIRRDPSRLWVYDQSLERPADSNDAIDSFQRDALELLPTSFYHAALENRWEYLQEVTSWELRHAMARFIERLCFIPKRKPDSGT